MVQVSPMSGLEELVFKFYDRDLKPDDRTS